MSSKEGVIECPWNEQSKKVTKKEEGIRAEEAQSEDIEEKDRGQDAWHS